MSNVPTITRGNLKPDLQISISDAAGVATFTGLPTTAFTITAERDGLIVFSDTPDSVTLSNSNKTATLLRQWDPADVDTIGRMWIYVEVEWLTGKKQTFPDDGPLRLDVLRAAGDP